MKKETYGKIFRLLLIVGILAVSYFYGFRLLTAEVVNTGQRIEEAEQFYGKLLQKAANSEYYQEEIDRMEWEFDDVLASYRAGLSQEEDILFLHRLEEQTGIVVTDAEFSKEDVIYEFEKDSMPSRYNAGDSTGSLKGLSSSVLFHFQGSYDQMKNLVKFAEEYENYMVLSSIEALCQRDTGLIEGIAVVRRYAVIGADRKPEEEKLPEVDRGTDNIFGKPTPPEPENPEDGAGEEGEENGESA